jgi:hypothetical protein
MAKDLTPRSPNAPAQRGGGEVATPGGAGEFSTRSSGRLTYKLAERVAFDLVPDEVARQLRGQNLLAGPEIAAWAKGPVTRRRGDGSAYQVISAWWAGEARLLVFDATRDLAEAGKGRFRPTGTWTAHGTVYQFPPGVSAATYTSAPAAGGPQAGTHSQALAITGDPLEVLPEYLRSPLRGGTAGAYLETTDGYARETIVAQRVAGGRAHVLRAQREAGSKRALPGAAWTITSLEAPVHAHRELAIAPRRPTSAGLSRRETSQVAERQARQVEKPQTCQVEKPQARQAEKPQTYW